MIIDYFNCEAYKIFFQKAVKPPERCSFDARKDYGIYARYVEHVMSPGEGGGPRYTRYISFHGMKTSYETATATENFGPFGLFSRTIKIQKANTSPDFDTKARFSILGTLFQHDENYSDTGIFEVVDYWDKNQKLLYDVETGLPCILKQPTNLKEIQILLRADPRYVAYIDPAIVKAEEVVRGYKLGYAIVQAAQQGLDRIFGSQATLGVVFDDAESEERRKFVEETKLALGTFMDHYNEMLSGAYEVTSKVKTNVISYQVESETSIPEQSDGHTSSDD